MAPSIENNIVQDLRRRLVNGTLAAGERLRAEVLKSDYGTSASTVRDALFRLATEGIVEFREQRGFRAQAISPRLLRELTLVRIIIETQGANLSLQRAGLEWEARLTAAYHKLAHIESRMRANLNNIEILDLWIESELEFHQTLIDASELTTLIDLHRNIYYRFRQQQIIIDRDFKFLPENEEQHQAILSVALDRDAGLLGQKISEHLGRFLDQLQTAMSDSSAY